MRDNRRVPRQETQGRTKQTRACELQALPCETKRTEAVPGGAGRPAVAEKMRQKRVQKGKRAGREGGPPAGRRSRVRGARGPQGGVSGRRATLRRKGAEARPLGPRDSRDKPLAFVLRLCCVCTAFVLHLYCVCTAFVQRVCSVCAALVCSACATLAQPALLKRESDPAQPSAGARTVEPAASRHGCARRRRAERPGARDEALCQRRGEHREENKTGRAQRTARAEENREVVQAPFPRRAPLLA